MNADEMCDAHPQVARWVTPFTTASLESAGGFPLAAAAFAVKGNTADCVVHLHCVWEKVLRSRVTYGPSQSPPSATIKFDFQWLLTTSKVTPSDSTSSGASCWHWGGPVENNHRGFGFILIIPWCLLSAEDIHDPICMYTCMWWWHLSEVLPLSLAFNTVTYGGRLLRY